MGQVDFEFGFNESGYCVWCGKKHEGGPENCKPNYKTDDPPSYAQACMGLLVCPHCGKAVMCGDVVSKTIQTEDNKTMDVGQYKGAGGSSRLDWLDGQHIPEKGGSLRIDAAREPRKKGNVIIYLDVTVVSPKDKEKDKRKYTWSIRKGFTLDALMESLGTDTDKWEGKTLAVVRGGDAGQYVNVSE